MRPAILGNARCDRLFILQKINTRVAISPPCMLNKLIKEYLDLKIDTVHNGDALEWEAAQFRSNSDKMCIRVVTLQLPNRTLIS